VWLVIARLGADVSGPLLPAFTVHVNVRDVVTVPSDTNTVTLNEPADVGVPLLIPEL